MMERRDGVKEREGRREDRKMGERERRRKHGYISRGKQDGRRGGEEGGGGEEKKTVDTFPIQKP